MPNQFMNTLTDLGHSSITFFFVNASCCFFFFCVCVGEGGGVTGYMRIFYVFNSVEKAGAELLQVPNNTPVIIYDQIFSIHKFMNGLLMRPNLA